MRETGIGQRNEDSFLESKMLDLTAKEYELLELFIDSMSCSEMNP